MGPGDYGLLAVAGVAAGAVNAVAGGGSLISFPALVATGLPALGANVTNQVAVLPGYLGGSLAYRDELRGQRRRVVVLGVGSALGALVGAILLVLSSERLFAVLAPVLVLVAVALLAAQPSLARFVQPRRPHEPHARGLHVANFLASVYGGYFGAGLGIMLLAILAIGLEDALQRLNALKGVLSLVVAVVAAAYFAAFGPVRWEAAAVMAVASFAGGQVGVRFARRIDDRALRWGIVVVGTGVAVWLFVRL
ncbi:MAG: sulfite exporter TauE/SafE family protein [Thermoleophilaceae bacterium]